VKPARFADPAVPGPDVDAFTSCLAGLPASRASGSDFFRDPACVEQGAGLKSVRFAGKVFRLRAQSCSCQIRESSVRGQADAAG
jgi:hypothetical protein